MRGQPMTDQPVTCRRRLTLSSGDLRDQACSAAAIPRSRLAGKPVTTPPSIRLVLPRRLAVAARSNQCAPRSPSSPRLAAVWFVAGKQGMTSRNPCLSLLMRDKLNAITGCNTFGHIS